MQRSRGGRILGAEVLTSWEGRARTITPGRNCAPESHTRRRGVCLRDSDAFSWGRVLRMGGRQVSAPRSGGGPVPLSDVVSQDAADGRDGAWCHECRASLHMLVICVMPPGWECLAACRTESAVGNESAICVARHSGRYSVAQQSRLSVMGRGARCRKSQTSILLLNLLKTPDGSDMAEDSCKRRSWVLTPSCDEDEVSGFSYCGCIDSRG